MIRTSEVYVMLVPVSVQVSGHLTYLICKSLLHYAATYSITMIRILNKSNAWTPEPKPAPA